MHSAIPLWKHYYAESVEFALQHLEKGDKVFFLTVINHSPHVQPILTIEKIVAVSVLPFKIQYTPDWQGYFLMHLNQ